MTASRKLIPVNYATSFFYHVADIERTEAFYCDLLGLPIVRREGDAPAPFWLCGKLNDGPDLIFFQREATPGQMPYLIFDLREGGIDDVMGGLEEEGVTIITPVSDAPGGGWSAEFLDPDGYRLGLWQSTAQPRSRR